MQAPDLQAHLHSFEERLLHPSDEPDRSALAPLLAPEFQEFASSGRIYNREQTLEILLSSPPRAATICFYYVTPLAPDVALATYHATIANTLSYRSSLWVHRDHRWQLLFHQGTIAHTQRP